MRTLKNTSKNSNLVLKEALNSIKKGEVVVCPTDTVYGLVCDATNKKAVDRLFKIKKRSVKKFLPLFVKDIAMAKKLAFIDKNQEKILQKKWPGKTTFVLKRRKSQKAHGISQETIALRMPDYQFLSLLMERIKKPLTGTSANISGQPFSSKVKEIIDQFNDKKDRPDLVLDTGSLPKGKPSKIIDLTGPEPKILRK